MFQFSLQTALNVRSRQEKIKMKELAEKLAVEQRIINQINKINNDTKIADQKLNQTKETRVFTIDQMMFLSHFKARMKIVLGQHHQQLKTAKQEVAEKQQALIEASRAKKTLEILKEKEMKKYLEKFARIERKNMDEIAGNLFIQNRIRASS